MVLARNSESTLRVLCPACGFRLSCSSALFRSTQPKCTASRCHGTCIRSGLQFLAHLLHGFSRLLHPLCARSRLLFQLLGLVFQRLQLREEDIALLLHPSVRMVLHYIPRRHVRWQPHVLQRGLGGVPVLLFRLASPRILRVQPMDDGLHSLQRFFDALLIVRLMHALLDLAVRLIDHRVDGVGQFILSEHVRVLAVAVFDRLLHIERPLAFV
mmetsp:Transcript_1035/g.3028  ORF Transcript_1035/g.3028 Transcript_1035/m.3028 type:complete len:213 (-) Transcript_1035:170-808(-)